ncbi:MAG TPA: sulfatase-like hydrolase/transferase [Thermoanaerobaculia bacterium]|nr:sulfatase-like hydrolase/transferase [Thermoanaerobaculia bacterium]
MLRRLATLIPIAVLLACGRETARDTAPVASPGSPVIIISIDTLRADRLPAYGYRGVETPAIDALRRDAILYENAYSHCPMTLPSHLSLLTGLLPYQHEVRNNLGYTFDGSKFDSLPAMLKRAGYATGAAVSAYVLRSGTGVGPLFDFYDDRVGGASNVAIGDLAREGNATVAAADQWVAEHASKPFFFFLHVFEPHWPYEAPEPFRSRFTNSYDAEVAAADAAVGRFIARLKELGVYDRATVLLLSDHGEGLGDHGEGEHGVFLYREVMRVPLLLKLPKSERGGETIAHPVQLIDVAPTIASLTGTTSRAPLAGTSLLAASQQPRRIYSETMLPRIHFGWSGLRSLVDARHHFIEAPRVELYDVAGDPGERTNIAAEERRVLAGMRQAIAAHAADLSAPGNVDPEEAAKLAALGYLGQTRANGDGGALPDPKDRIADLEQLKAASVLERGGQISAAIAQYESIVKSSPQFADAWFRLAVAQEKVGRLEDAVRSYRAGINAAPMLAQQMAVSVGSLQLRLGQLDEAAAHANLALKSQPGAAHHLLGRIALARGDRAGAERAARLAMDDSLYRNAGGVLLALIAIDQGKPAEALRLLDEVKKSAREPVPDLEMTRGDALARMEHITEAESAFRAEIAAFPNNRQAYTRLAVLYAMLGRGPDAEQTLQRMFNANRSAATAQLAAETWTVVENGSAAARWSAKAAAMQ